MAHFVPNRCHTRSSDAQKNELKPWLVKMWCIPPDANPEFVWKMERVLSVYKRPYDPLRPVVCMDETPRQLIAETREPIARAPGRAERHDYEYERRGTYNIFMASEPLAGSRMIEVTERKTRKDWARFI